MAQLETSNDSAAVLHDAHLAEIVHQSLDAIVSKDIEGTVRSWNRGAERIFGWTAAEMVGLSIRRIVPADRLLEEDAVLARLRAGELIGRFETERVRKDGHRIHVAVTVSPIRNAGGHVIGASKIAHDISETVSKREELVTTAQQFRTLANSIPQLAWIADGEGNIFWYNDRWYDYTGATLDEMRGWGWTRVHHPDHVERVKARIQRSWDSGDEWEDTFPLRGKDGEYRWFLSRAKPVLGPDGRVRQWFGTNTDITLQLQSEQQIEMLMGELTHRARNMISVIQAVVNRTVDKKYADDLANRLHALSRNQDLLTRRNWGGAPLGELIRSQLASIEDVLGTRIFLDGVLDLVINPSTAETIGLAVHELATNAAKYGAMSNHNGTIRIQCTVRGSPGDERLCIEWEERGGPPVVKPDRTGFGTVMIDRNPRYALNADVEYGYPASGFFWRMSAPLSIVRGDKPGTA